MELSQVLTAIVGWAVLSVPVSLLIGAFMSRGSRTGGEIAIPVHVSKRA
jgi:hypothetical protein